MAADNAKIIDYKSIIGSSAKPRLMDEPILGPDFERIDKVIPGCTAQPTDYQRICVAGLLRLAITPTVMFANHAGATNGERAYVKTCAATLSAAFGAGKTLMALLFAWLFAMQVRVMNPAIVTGPTVFRAVKLNDQHATPPDQKYVHDTTSRVISDAPILPITIIVVGQGVLKQWEESIARWFPSATVLVVDNHKKLATFEDYVEKGVISNFRFILVKQGDVANVNLKAQAHKNTDGRKATATQPMVIAISDILGDRIVESVIMDDADMLIVNSHIRRLNALFTVYVSATRSEKTKRNAVRAQIEPTIEGVLAQRPTTVSAMGEAILYNGFSITPCPQLVRSESAIPDIVGYKVVVQCHHDGLMDAVRVAGGQDGNKIAEMLNAGALGTAAGMVGSQVSSVGDIYEELTGGQYNHMQKLLARQATLLRFKMERVVPFMKSPEARLNRRVHTQEQVKAIMEVLSSDLAPNAKLPETPFISRPLIDALGAYAVALAAELTDMKVRIDMVIASVKDGRCKVCTKSMTKKPNVMIHRQCGAPICSDCVSHFHLRNQRQYQHDNHMGVSGKCPVCAKGLIVSVEGKALRSDILFVVQSSGFNLQSLVTGVATVEIEPEPELEPEVKSEALMSLEAKLATINNEKHRAVLEIIHGIVPKTRKPARVVYKKVMKGMGVTERPVERTPKSLIYSTTDESLKALAALFTEYNIKFAVLQGTRKEIEDIIAKTHTDEIEVLIASSTHHASGLDLQHFDRVILMYVPEDTEREEQIVGRLQRFGRLMIWGSAEVYYVIYPNEEHLLLTRG